MNVGDLVRYKDKLDEFTEAYIGIILKIDNDPKPQDNYFIECLWMDGNISWNSITSMEVISECR